MKVGENQARIKALGIIEGYKNEIDTVGDSLSAAPLWKPGTVLKKLCNEVLALIDDLKQRFSRKLVVTLIGPCGAGKSTLLNALAGVDDLSEVGNDRPTTRNPVILCRERNDAAQFIAHLGNENIKIKSSHAASALEHVILIDTPDTDSMEMEKHIPLVKDAISLSDVLICMFNSENPKRKDYVDFMSPYVSRFNGESLVCVMNKCDRQDETELKEVIMPEFISYIQSAWDKPVNSVLCIAARRHLHNPKWDEKSAPKHDFDQFEELRQMIFGTFNSAGYVIDRRLENASALRDYVLDTVRSEVEKDSSKLIDAGNRIREAQKQAVRESLSSLRRDDMKQQVGVNVMLYQKLSQRWVGPVGWLIALWARIMIFGTGIAFMFRFGHPIQQVLGMLSSFRHFKESRSAIAESSQAEQVDIALRTYQLSMAHTWPDIAETLINCRFDISVRQMDNIPEHGRLNEELSALWSNALDTAVETASRQFSGLFFQFIFNIPVLAILGYTGWITAESFFKGKYFTSDFFLHAFLTLGIILFLCFFLFQGCVRLFASSDRITGKAFEIVKSHAEKMRPLLENPIGEQVDMILRLIRIK